MLWQITPCRTFIFPMKIQHNNIYIMRTTRFNVRHTWYLKVDKIVVRRCQNINLLIYSTQQRCTFVVGDGGDGGVVKCLILFYMNGWSLIKSCGLDPLSHSLAHRCVALSFTLSDLQFIYTEIKSIPMIRVIPIWCLLVYRTENPTHNRSPKILQVPSTWIDNN